MLYGMIMSILFYHESAFYNYDTQWCQPSESILQNKKRTVVSNCSYLIRGKIFLCRSMQVDTQKSCSVLCSNRMQTCQIYCYFFLCPVSVQGSHNDTRGGCSSAQRPFDDISPKLQSFTLRLNTVVRLLLNPVLCVCFQRQITS